MEKLIKTSRILILTLMLVISIGVLSGCGKKENEHVIEEYEIPIKNMIEGVQNANIEQYKSAFPDFIDYELNQKDLDEIMEIYIDIYGQNIKISYEILEKQEIDSDKLQGIQENIKLYFDHDCSVTNGMQIKFNRTIKGDKDQIIEENTVNVYKIDGKWCIINF